MKDCICLLQTYSVMHPNKLMMIDPLNIIPFIPNLDIISVEIVIILSYTTFTLAGNLKKKQIVFSICLTQQRKPLVFNFFQSNRICELVIPTVILTFLYYLMIFTAILELILYFLHILSLHIWSGTLSSSLDCIMSSIWYLMVISNAESAQLFVHK